MWYGHNKTLTNKDWEMGGEESMIRGNKNGDLCYVASNQLIKLLT